MDTSIIAVGADEIIGGLDQTLPIGQSQKKMLKEVDEIMELAIEQNNPDIAANAIKGLLDISRISGLAMAK
ncbi:hypothetical protein OFL77_27230, partial [Escherichia coli]|uniref:hypothetical protein n=1 Tax=Escherichia coli TaxID=562 RepID=UPI0021DFB050